MESSQIETGEVAIGLGQVTEAGSLGVGSETQGSGAVGNGKQEKKEKNIAKGLVNKLMTLRRKGVKKVLNDVNADGERRKEIVLHDSRDTSWRKAEGSTRNGDEGEQGERDRA